MSIKTPFQLFFVFTSYLFSQSSDYTLVFGRVLDESGNPLANVMVQNEQTKTSSLTDFKGQFNVKFLKGNRTILYKSLGYTTLKKTYNFSEDTTYIFVTLNRKINQLATVEINSEKIQLAYKRSNAYIIDYEWLEDGILLLLKENKTYKLRWVDSDNNTLLEKIIPSNPEKFHRDCFENIAILYPEISYQIYVNNAELKLLPSISRLQYDKVILPCITGMKQNYYFQAYSHLNKAIHYLVVDTVLKTQTILQNVFQKESYEFAEYYYLKILKSWGNSINRMGDIYDDPRVPEDQKVVTAAEDAIENKWFYNHILVKNIYGPLLKLRDSIFIFDHVLDSAYLFDDSSYLVRKFPIVYHHKKGWKKELLVDPIAQHVYAKFIKDGLTYLHAINTSNGQVEKIHKLEKHVFLNHIKVRDGYAYYIYRDKIDNSNNYLYRQRLD